jgi:hypothetical protein
LSFIAGSVNISSAGSARGTSLVRPCSKTTMDA